MTQPCSGLFNRTPAAEARKTLSLDSLEFQWKENAPLFPLELSQIDR
jgi:hypothetical protein